MRIVDFIAEGQILPEIRSTKKRAVIEELARHLSANDSRLGTEEVVRVILERERLGSTAIGEGIAIPHGKLASVETLTGLLARSRKGIEFESQDGEPTHLFVVLIAPVNATGDHLKALARISRIFKNKEFREKLMKATTVHEMYQLIKHEDAPAP
jgi:nitrogen PTS system EIIA component